MDVSATLLQAVVSIISAVITTVLLPLVAQYLISKTNNQKLQSAITEITQTVATTVSYIEQVWVTELKSNSNWTEETKKDVYRLAVNTVINNLSSATTNWLEKNSDDISEVIGQYVEAFILQSKQGGQPDENNKA